MPNRMSDERLSSGVVEVHIDVRGAQLVLQGEASTMRASQFGWPTRARLGLLKRSRSGPIFSPDPIKKPALSFGFCEPRDFVTDGR